MRSAIAANRSPSLWEVAGVVALMIAVIGLKVVSAAAPLLDRCFLLECRREESVPGIGADGPEHLPIRYPTFAAQAVGGGLWELRRRDFPRQESRP